jgi:hypothetical protein
MATLFSCGFKRKTSETSAEDIEQAAAARADQERADLRRLREKAAEMKAAVAHSLDSLLGEKKTPSQSKEAIRKRNERAAARKTAAKKAAKEAKTPRERATIDAEKCDIEKETHYVDVKVRKRKRKTTRTRVASGGVMTKAGSRKWTQSERSIVVELHKKVNSFGAPDYARVARELHVQQPQMFGNGAPAKPNGITHQDVRAIVLAHEKGEISDGRGRPAALPEFLNLMIIAALSSVVSARATICSASLLQPVAIGVIIAMGFGDLLNAGRNRRGVFCCGLDYVRGLMKDHGWRNVRPQADTRKLPDGYQSKCWDFVLRLAYLVFVHLVPASLVVNADHTGVMFTQIKGNTWITAEQVKAKDKSVQGHGDKRQFTLLASTSAAGDTLKHQVVVEGKTAGSLPKFHEAGYITRLHEQNTKGSWSICFVLRMAVAAVANIGSFCCTANHWSDNVTSKAYVTDIFVPYCRAKIEALRAVDPSLSKPFGEQICVLILDCWWGWLDKGFLAFIKEKYPWIRVLFVPAACTPVAQPMDAGIIAKIKGLLRRFYGRWACDQTVSQIKGGAEPKDVKIPADVKTCRKNLLIWLSQSVESLDKAGVIHCWKSTQLLRAWEREVQVEAGKRVDELFGKDPNDAGIVVDVSGQEDIDAMHAGQAFAEIEVPEEEWMGWVNWELVTGGAGGSA